MSTYPPPPPPAYNPGQPHPGYGAPMQGYGQPAYSQNNVVVVQQRGIAPVSSGCPVCGIGVVREQYSLVGILIALIFFPIGILCCLCMTERRCSNCNAAL